MMLSLTDAELQLLGVEEELITQRRELNEQIAAGKTVAVVADDILIPVSRAFISNPCGYNKVFLRTADGEVLEWYQELRVP